MFDENGEYTMSAQAEFESQISEVRARESVPPEYKVKAEVTGLNFYYG